MRNLLTETQPSRVILKSIRNLFFPSGEPGFDYDVTVEISSVCNARCSFCIYRLGLRERAVMSVKEFSKTASACYESGARSMNFTSFGGEVFLNKDAIEIFKEAKRIGFERLSLFTNAIAIHKFDVEEVVSLLDEIRISFPGFDADIYNELYQVDRYDEFERSVKLLVEAHEKLNADTEIIFHPRTYLTRKQLLAAPFYKDFLQGYIGPKIWITRILYYLDTWNGAINSMDAPRMKFEFPPLKSIYPLKKTHLCIFLFAVNVLVDGKVRLCNCRFDDSISGDDPLCIDNLNNHKSLSALFGGNNEVIQRLLHDYQHGKLPHVCSNCTFYHPCKPDKGDLQKWFERGFVRR